MTLTGWAADYAEELLAPLGDRWAHVQGVVRQAERVAAILPAEEREVLVAAAYLHDLGYAPALRVTLFRRRFWLPATRVAGLDGLRIHDLRHTAVALWIAAGANPKEVAARAGHASVSFTLDRYGHLYPESDLTLRERLDAIWSASSGGS
jgi:integrase